MNVSLRPFNAATDLPRIVDFIAAAQQQQPERGYVHVGVVIRYYATIAIAREGTPMGDTQQPYRMDRSVLTITTLDDAPDDTQFWLTHSAAERLAALEFMRQAMYGYDPTTAQLQRVLTIAQRPTR